MEKFIINYHTGVTEEVEVSSLDQAQEAAQEGMTYTQEKVTIESAEGEVLATSYWYSVQPGEDDEVVASIGEFGFYGDWVLGE